MRAKTMEQVSIEVEAICVYSTNALPILNVSMFPMMVVNHHNQAGGVNTRGRLAPRVIVARNICTEDRK
jgi:hypothetical protein